jgi:integrase/recombinase XerD
MQLFRRHLADCPHRRDGRRHWRCRCPVWFDGTISTRRVLKSTGCTDWDEAHEVTKEWLAGRVAVKPKCKAPAKAPQEEPVSVEQTWSKFIAQAEARNLSPSTIYKYDLLRRGMLDFIRRAEITALQDVKLDVLEAFQTEWKEGPLARVKKLERIKAFFRFAFERHWITENPARLLKAPKVRPRPTMPFTQEEMAAILAAFDCYPDKSGKIGRANARRLRAFVLALRYTGLRIGDVTRLTAEQVEGQKVFLYTQKTGQPVNCVVPGFVAEALQNLPPLSDRYFFWTGKSTLHTAVGSWQRSLSKLFKRAGIQRGYAHRFRDTFAVDLLLAGMTTEEVAVLLGHSSIAITQKHYSPWVHARQRQLEANLERAWNRDPIALLQANVELKLNNELPN